MTRPHQPVPQDVSLLPVFRALSLCSQRAERLMTRLLEEHDLTPSQFDVLATLGDTDGLSFKELSEQSFVTGGTLTPVLNRMEAKGLVRRCKHETDNRKVLVKLTPEGQTLYERTFMPLVDLARVRLEALSPDEQSQLIRLLDKLAGALD